MRHDSWLAGGVTIQLVFAWKFGATPELRRQAAHTHRNQIHLHMLKISRGAVLLGIAYAGLACTPQHRASAERAGFDPLEYPGDSALTCEVIGAGGSTHVALQFTGTDSSPILQRRITAVFDARGRPRLLDLLVPEPRRTPPRAHWLRVQFQPDVVGSHAVVDSGGGESFRSIMRAADAAAQPMGGGEMARAQSFMSRLWARRCNVSQG